jgi:hypothetical protein
MEENRTQESNDISFDRIKITFIYTLMNLIQKFTRFLTFESFSNIESID